MRKLTLAATLAALGAWTFTSTHPCESAAAAARSTSTQVSGRPAPWTGTAPRFVENAGQMPAGVAFVAAGRDRSVVLGPRAMTVELRRDGHRAAVEMAFDGAAGAAAPRGERPTRATYHWFRGTDGASRAMHARTFSGVAYDEAWPGVDLRIDARPSAVEYSLVVRPGADAGAARFRVRGAERIERTEAGELALTTPLGTVTQSRPVAWQDAAIGRVPVEVEFDVRSDADTDPTTFGFRLGEYDRSRAVVIDPTIEVVTLPTGVAADDALRAHGVDSKGNVLVAGYTSSPSAVPSGAGFDDSLGGVMDTYVAKFTGDGDLVWASFLGGSNDDRATGLAVDAQGRAIVAGLTSSANFPFRSGPTATPSGTFLSKFAADGASLVYSGYVEAGAYAGSCVAAGADGAVYIAGSANGELPETTDLTPGQSNGIGAFAMKFAPSGVRVWSLRLGADVAPYGQTALAIDVDAAGAAYVAGSTSGPDSLAPAAATGRPYGGGLFDGFVVKINPAGTALEYATYLGGTASDGCGAIAVDPSGAAYVAGQTHSTVAAFPRRVGPDTDTTEESPAYGFVAKVSPSGQNLEFVTALRAVQQGSYLTLDYGATAANGDVYVNYNPGIPVRVRGDGSDVAIYPGVAGSGAPSVRPGGELFVHNNSSILRVTETGDAVPTPGGVAAVALSAQHVRVFWDAAASGVTSYDIERARGTGSFVLAGTVSGSPPLFDDTDLLPDTVYRYRVRARDGTSASWASPTVVVRTPGTFSLRVTRGLLLDAKKARRDKAEIDALAMFESATSFDPSAEALSLSVGDGAGAYVLDVAAGDSRWKSKKGVLSFVSNSAAGRVALRLDTRRGKLRLRASRLQFAGLPADPAEVSLVAGDEADSDAPAWKRSGDALRLLGKK